MLLWNPKLLNVLNKLHTISSIWLIIKCDHCYFVCYISNHDFSVFVPITMRVYLTPDLLWKILAVRWLKVFCRVIQTIMMNYEVGGNPSDCTRIILNLVLSIYFAIRVLQHSLCALKTYTSHQQDMTASTVILYIMILKHKHQWFIYLAFWLFRLFWTQLANRVRSHAAALLEMRCVIMLWHLFTKCDISKHWTSSLFLQLFRRPHWLKWVHNSPIY